MFSVARWGNRSFLFIQVRQPFAAMGVAAGESWNSAATGAAMWCRSATCGVFMVAAANSCTLQCSLEQASNQHGSLGLLALCGRHIVQLISFSTWVRTTTAQKQTVVHAWCHCLWCGRVIFATATTAQRCAEDYCGCCDVCLLELVVLLGVHVGEAALAVWPACAVRAQEIVANNTLYPTRLESFFRQAPARAALCDDLLGASTIGVSFPQHYLKWCTCACRLCPDASCPAAVLETLMPVFLDPVRALRENSIPGVVSSMPL